MMSRSDGTALTLKQSIEQSIEDILTTPIGSRIMRRDYGSILADLIDQPTNDLLIIKMYSAIYTPINQWEERISIESIAVSNLKGSSMQVDLETVLVATGEQLNLSIPLKLGAAA